MTKIVFAVMCIAALAARAGTYEETDFKLQVCESQGKRGELAFYFKNDVEQQKQIAKSCEGIWLELLCVETQIFAVTQAVSEESAYRHGWAYCMDNYEKALAVSRKKEARAAKRK
jgi:hypothetical protein